MTDRAVSLLKPQNLYKFHPLNTIIIAVATYYQRLFIHNVSNNSS